MAIRVGYIGDGVVNTGFGVSGGTYDNIVPGDYTFYCKFSVDGSNINNSGLFALQVGTTRYFTCRIQNGTPCKLQISNNTSFANYWEFTIENYSELVCLCFKMNTATPTAPTVYVNGVLKTFTTVGTAVSLAVPTSLVLFYWNGGAGTNGMSGTIYDLAIYERLLSDREVKSLSQGFIDPNILNPNCLYRFLQNGSPFRNIKYRAAANYTNTFYSRHLPT